MLEEFQWNSRFVSGSSQETCKQVGDFAYRGRERYRGVPQLRMHLLVRERPSATVLNPSQGRPESRTFVPKFIKN